MSNVRQGTIIACQFGKEYQTTHGTLYAYSVTFDNGDKGELSKKTNTYNGVGQSMQYTLEPKGNYPAKIKEVKPPYNGQGGQSQGYSPQPRPTQNYDQPQDDRLAKIEKHAMIARQSSFDAAVLLNLGQSHFDVAEQIACYCLTGKVANSVADATAKIQALVSAKAYVTDKDEQMIIIRQSAVKYAIKMGVLNLADLFAQAGEIGYYCFTGKQKPAGVATPSVPAPHVPPAPEPEYDDDLPF